MSQSVSELFSDIESRRICIEILSEDLKTQIHDKFLHEQVHTGTTCWGGAGYRVVQGHLVKSPDFGFWLVHDRHMSHFDQTTPNITAKPCQRSHIVLIFCHSL